MRCCGWDALVLPGLGGGGGCLHSVLGCAEALCCYTAPSDLTSSSSMYIILTSHDSLEADSWFFGLNES